MKPLDVFLFTMVYGTFAMLLSQPLDMLGVPAPGWISLITLSSICSLIAWDYERARKRETEARRKMEDE